jgi:hypothetical protein
MWATATGKRLDCGSVQFSLTYIFSPVDWTCKHYAEKLETKALNLRSRLLGEEHLDTIAAMSNLANTYVDFGKYTDAEMLAIKVLDVRNKLFGEMHPHTTSAS